MSKQDTLTKILVVDDDKEIVNLFHEFLSVNRYSVTTAISANEAINLCRINTYDAVLLDINMPRVSGLAALNTILDETPNQVVIMISAIHDVDMVVKCIKIGACDFIVKPIVDLGQIPLRIDHAIENVAIKRENVQLKRDLIKHTGIPSLNSKSPKMITVQERIQTVAEYDTTVFITGKSGTGKEIAAKTIHQLSNRSNKPFVAVNCSAIPATLLESTLFGHEPGSFTGANTRKIGLFEESNNGTIFLDEITETSSAFQVRLLRVLEENRIRRVGGDKEIPLNLRIIAASNQNMEDALKNKIFRMDLYYRLNVFSINIPTLIERSEDIPAIAKYHLNCFSQNMGKTPNTLSPEVLKVLCSHTWPGNIRELVNVLENAIIMTRTDEISLESLPQYLIKTQLPSATGIAMDGDYQSAKDNFDRIYYKNLINQTNGNITQAAKLAKVSRQHFHLRLKQLDL